jgi:4-amino-4-deoxy-L-arabinose transferase-like glycosyltransferase
MIDRPVAFLARGKQPFSAPQLLAASLLTAMIAQALLIQSYQQFESFWDIQNWISNPFHASPVAGLLFYGFAGGLFIRALMLTGHSSTSFEISQGILQTSAPRFGLWITCLGISAVLGYSVTTASAYLHGPLLASIWLINISLFVGTVVIAMNVRLPSLQAVNQWLYDHRWELSGVLIILFIAFMMRFWNLELHPYAFINDEGEMGWTAFFCIQLGNCNNLFETSWAGQPVLAFVPTFLSISVFGNTAMAVRLVSVIIGTLAVLAVYLFTREVFGHREAWLAMALLAVLPVHVHFSRLGVDNIIDSLSTTAVLGFLFLGIKRGSTMGFLAAGIVGGLCMYTYPGTRLAPIMGMVAIGYIVLKTRGALKAHAFNVFIFIFSLIVTVAPIAGYFMANPAVFFGRMQEEGIFQTQSIHAGNVVGILTEQFMKSSLVFILTSAPTNFFHSPRPYLTPLAAIFFMLGLCYTIWRIREERFFILFIWFWAAILLGSTFTGGPPTSQRMLMSTPPLAIITAIGICRFTEVIPKTLQHSGRLQALCLLIFIAWVAGKDVTYYQYEYRLNHYFEDTTNEFTYETAAEISQLHSDGRLYLLADPQTNYLSFANFNYFSPDVEKTPLDEVTPQILADLPTDKDALFIATPDHVDDLRKIAAFIPGGTWNEVLRRFQPTYALYYSYKLAQADLQAFTQ